MTQPKLARQNRSDDDGPRIYAWPPKEPHEFEVVSVTSATGGGFPKPWLIGWAAKVTAEAAVDDHDIVAAMLAKGNESDAINHLKRARYKTMHEKGDRGTIVHKALETFVEGTEQSTADIEAALKAKRVPKKMWRSTHVMIDGVLAFLYDVEPEVCWSESTVFSRTHRYAGTPDLICRMMIDGKIVPVIVDIKTSKSIYDETAMQLTAYARADFVGTIDGKEMPLLPGGNARMWNDGKLDPRGAETIEYGVVVRPKPGGGYETGTFRLTDGVFRLFLGCLQVATNTGELAKSRVA